MWPARALLTAAIVLSILVVQPAGASQHRVEARPAGVSPAHGLLGGFIDPSGEVNRQRRSRRQTSGNWLNCRCRCSVGCLARHRQGVPRLDGAQGPELDARRHRQSGRHPGDRVELLRPQHCARPEGQLCRRRQHHRRQRVPRSPPMPPVEGLRQAVVPVLVPRAEPDRCRQQRRRQVPGRQPVDLRTSLAAHLRHLPATGATNVSFVWGPSMGGPTAASTLEQLWPGSQYVNWIGMDGYSRSGPQQGGAIPPDPTFTQLFGATYTTLTSSFFGDLPMMISETGADGVGTDAAHQSAYLSRHWLRSVPRGPFRRSRVCVLRLDQLAVDQSG